MDVAVIGAYGSAGVAAADQLSNYVGGVIDQLFLIDGGEPGGLCILDGCMPSKAVLSSAKHAHDTNTDPRVAGKSEVDIEKTIDHKNRHISRFAEHRGDSVREIAEHDNIELIESDIRFKNEHTLETRNGRELDVDYTVVSTGSKLNIPDLDGLDEVNYLTSTDILDLKDLPESVIVMGFGAIGMEMSAYLSSVGVDVTAIEHDKSPIDNGSDDFGEEVVDIYRDEFDVDVITETYERSVREVDGDVRLDLSNGESVTAEELCLFTGRNPNLEGLELDELNSQQNWYADSLQVAGTDSVFVAGDATGDRMILHIAKEQGVLAAENIRRRIEGSSMETYSSPEHIVYFTGNGKYPFSRYGVSGDEGEKRDDLLTFERYADDDGIFSLKEADRGLAKLVVDKNTGVVKGYEALHLHADIMLKTMQVIIEQGVDVREVPSRAYHPTTPEILDGLFREASSKVQD